MIFVIEPDVILARQYAVALQNIGLSSKFFSDPQTAIEYIEQDIPEAIVLELKLAPLSGVSLLQELRSYEDLATIPVIVYSSIPQESFNINASQWRQYGVVDYFYKPQTNPNAVFGRVSARIAERKK